MAQFARPSSDVLTTGWTPTPGGTLFSTVDEAVTDDADFINTGATVTVKFGLSSITDPVSSTGHIIRVRARTTSGGTITAALTSSGGGTTYYPATSIGVLAGSFTDYALTLSGPQADSITNYATMELWLAAAPAALNNVTVSQAYFETPDAPVIPVVGVESVGGRQTVRQPGVPSVGD